jgi:hypothetical protein
MRTNIFKKVFQFMKFKWKYSNKTKADVFTEYNTV